MPVIYDIRGKADTSGSIAYTITTLDTVEQGTLTNAITVMYERRGSVDIRIQNIRFTNTTGVAVTGVELYVNGSAPANRVCVFDIPADGTATYHTDGGLDIMDSTGEVVNRIGLTDSELRASPVPITGTVTSTPSGTQDVDIIANSIGLGTEATLIQVRDYLDTVETKLASLLTELQLKADLTETQPVSIASSPLPTGASTEATLIQVRDYLDTVETKLQSLITALGSPFQAGANIGNTAFTANAGTNLNTSALNLEATQQLVLTALSTIVGYTDTIESLIATTNSLITTLNSKDFATQTTLNTLLKPADTLNRVSDIVNVVKVSDNAGSLTVDAPVATPVHVRLSDGSAAITVLPVSAPIITKGTQGSTGFTVQNLIDAGRTTLGLTMEFTATGTTETLATVTESRNGASGVSFTTRIITLGKRLRIQSIAMEVETLGSGTAPQRMYLRLRTNTTGATTATSPIQGVWAVVNSTAVVKSGNMMTYNFPDGIEFAGNGTASYGFTLQFPDYVATTGTVAGKVTIIAFEY